MPWWLRMMLIGNSRGLAVFGGSLLLALLLSLGCGEPEQIRSYSVPKEGLTAVGGSMPGGGVDIGAGVPTNQPTGEPTDRMLTAIVPTGDMAYFFKVIGSIAALDASAKEIDAFFATIRVGADGKATWKVPEGWQEGPAKPMRVATLLVRSAAGQPLEVAITQFPWAGTDEGLLMNVNRWRGQIQLPSTDAAHLGESTRKVKAGEAELTVVDLRGWAGSSVMPPFAGRGATNNSGNGQKVDGGAVGEGEGSSAGGEGMAGLPAGHPPIGGVGPPVAVAEPTAQDEPIPKFSQPAGWQSLPGSGFSRASFAIGEEKQGARFTLSDFPTGGGLQIAEVLPNVNRWRGEVGLPPITEAELSKSTEPLVIGGVKGTYIRAVAGADEPEPSKGGLSTLAAMVTRGERVWFFKLIGERSVVEAQEAAFKGLLKSVEFVGGNEPSEKAPPGGTDGNK